MQRVVFDTSTVVSALRFPRSRLTWLREHWRSGCVSLVSSETAHELVRVLAYPKFSLEPYQIENLLADYLPFCRLVEITQTCPIACRDRKDQPLLDLAHSGAADVLVTGDGDLLALDGQTAFEIISSGAYSERFAPSGSH